MPVAVARRQRPRGPIFMAMPELPDIELYLRALRPRIVGATLERIRVRAPFLLRSVEPPPEALEGRGVEAVRRIGKRIVIALAGDRYVVLHLMIAGRLRWEPRQAKSRTGGLASFEFSSGTLRLTEAGTKRRAALHLVAGAEGLQAFDRGGLDVLSADTPSFVAALRRENHTLKRALTDPTILDGIGNAYSDEILHAARLSPLALTSRLTDEALTRLHQACRDTLTAWVDRLRRQAGDGWPEKVTAFRPEMAVHGRFGQPCPVCATPVQRIVYAENETNYCPSCQTGGRLLADRALSRLLREDWPRTLAELEERLGK
jgi:formamidopyrimidine-DNA glycosylase